jgi:hypothetical protein
MSARNGDKSRFGRQRKQKIARRLELRGLKAALVAPPATGEAPSDAEAKPKSGLAGVAHAIGSALGTLAVETHLAGSPAQAE